MRPLYIFDLDGTLALTDHRQPILDDTTNPHRWRDFFAACVDDKPNEPVIHTMHMLRQSGAECWIWSGRSDEVREQTVDWLVRHKLISKSWRFGPAWAGILPPEMFRMRKAGDFTPDEVLKRTWLNEIDPIDYARLTAVFDDRSKVVQMWREEGVPCFQVAPGEF